MNPTIALHLWNEQERLERLGWVFRPRFSETHHDWTVRARHSFEEGLGQSFQALTKEAAMMEAVRYVAFLEMTAEPRDTQPAPAMGAAQ